MNEKSILIVEDDFVLAQNTKYILLTVGYKNISIARNSKEALQFLKKSIPSVILMDINLDEDIDGISLASKINSQYSIPHIFLVSNFDASKIERITTTTSFSYIQKPIDAQELKINIEILLHKHKLEQDLVEQKNSLTQAFNAIKDGIITIDDRGNITFVNDSARNYLLLNEEINNSLFMDIHNKFVLKKEYFLNPTFFIDETVQNEFETELFINNQKRYFIYTIEKIRLSSHSSFLITLKDITDQKNEEESRKLVEESLKINEKKFFDLVNNLPVSITRYIISTNSYEFSNNAFEKQFGATVDVLRDLTPDQRLGYIHEEDLPTVKIQYDNWALNNFEGVITLDYRGYNYFREQIWLKNFLYADFDENNNPYALTQIGVDVSNLKTAELALTKALKADLRTTVENLLNLVLRIRKENNDFIILFCEGILAQELGLTVKEEVYFHKHFDTILSKGLQPSLEYCFTGKSIQNEMYFNNRYILFWFQPIIVDNVTTEIVGSAVDITIQKEVQHKLRESDHLQGMLIDLLPIGVIQYSYYPDEKQQFVFERTNPFTLRLLQIESINDLRKNILRDSMSKESSERYSKLIEEWDRANDGTVFKHNVQLTTPIENEFVWVQIQQSKYYISDFQSRYICVIIDISKEKNDEQKLKHLASFAEQTPMIILEIDAEMNMIYVNPYAVQRFPSIATQGVFHDIFKNLEISSSTKFPLTIESEFQGVVFEQSVFYLPETNYYRIFSYEITSRKEIETELLRTLEKERELASLQNQFVTTVSHEFRTPLTGILTSCELIEVYSQKMTQEKLNFEIGKIKSRVEDLTKLMNNFIVQSSKLGIKERFNPQFHEFNNFVTRIIEDNKTHFEQKNITVSFTTDRDVHYVLIDESMLRQSIQNIIMNCITYSPVNSSVKVHISNQNNTIITTIKDNGIGIPADEIDNIFSPFYRASNTSNISGSGLGLSIAKEFIEINKGEIFVKSTIGDGTTVTILLESKSQTELNS